MSFVKRNYVDGETVITAENLNDIQDELIRIGGDGLSEDVKQALLQIASKVAYIDEDGQDYYDALESALYPPDGLVSISAVYTQSGTVYDTDSLDDLKDDLVVTAHYSDDSTETITAYTLSGELTAGTSTITVLYGRKATAFTVTVTQKYVSISATYTPIGRVFESDPVASLKNNLVVTGTTSDSATDILPANSYELSGTLSVGSSTITVAFKTLTTTFSVTVSAGSLPSEYTRVEYIEAEQTNTKTGAYINTLVKFTSHTLVTYKAGTFCTQPNLTQVGSTLDSQIVATRQTSTPDNVGFSVRVNNDRTSWSAWANTYINETADFSKYVDLVATRSSSAVTLKVNDGETKSASGTTRNCTGFNIGIFGNPSDDANQPGANYLYGGKIYYVEIIQDGTTKFNGIPCVQKSDGQIGFYDTVNSRFCYARSAGTNGSADAITAGNSMEVA